MVELLFTYGTLQSGQAPPEIAPVAARLRSLGTATACGRRFDLGAYPGAIFSSLSGPTSLVPGELFEVPDASTLHALDQYEGFLPANPEQSLFIRLQIEVNRTTTGESIRCWAYQYNQSVPEPSRQS
jgi:gamma-glutamylcyclotransferase (GGCT)/AIG2-like uncharacterized protein YtfP